MNPITEAYRGIAEKKQPLVISQSKLYSAVILLASILGVAGLFLFSSCNTQPVRAEEITLKASWYSIESLKKEGTWKKTKGRMSNGKLFNDNAYTCANRLYLLGTMLRITNLESGKSVIVWTTDRIGIRFAKLRIDLSRLAFSKLDKLEKGIIPVKVEVIHE